jgi:hypothetical protein
MCVTKPNLFYNLINLVLSEDQSDRPISNLEAEMSEATNMRVLSFAQDPTLQSVWTNLSSSTEPVRLLSSTSRPTR